MRILVSGSTRTVAQLAQQWPDHLGVLLTPNNWNSVESVVRTQLPWALDNGCYSANPGRGIDEAAFLRTVARAAGQPRLLWVVAPDVVGSARETLVLWDVWAPSLRAAGVPVAFVLQDGQERLALPDADAYFVGGSTRFKLSQASADLCREVKARGKLLHMGRVNTLRRLRVAHDRGCDSVDGTAVSMYGDVYLARFLAYVRELEDSPCLFD